MVKSNDSGPKRLMRGLFYSQEIMSSLGLIGLSVVSDFLKPEGGMSLARTNYTFFLIYSGICFSKITRFFATVLSELPQVKAVFGVMANFKTFLENMFGMMLCIFLVFGQFGINNFGGVVNSETPFIFEKIMGKPLPKDYHKMNFNDFPNSVVALYNIFMKNNWPTMSNMYLIEKENKNFRWFFLIFLVITTIVIMNLIIGFIVDVILSHLNKKYNKYIKIDDEMLKNIKRAETDFDSSEEEVEDEDAFVDDEKEADLETKARALAEAFNKGLEKNLQRMGMGEKKLDKKTEAQMEFMPLV